MAKKGVVIFDGEDKFITKKKHVYNKNKGQAKEVFLGVRADMDAGESPAEPVQSISEQGLSQGSTPTLVNNPINDAGIVSAGPSQEVISTPIGNIPSLPVVNIPPIFSDDTKSTQPVYNTPVYSAPVYSSPVVKMPSDEGRISTMPVYEQPVYIAPTPELPTWSTGTILTTTTVFEGDEGNEKLLRYPGGKPIDKALPVLPSTPPAFDDRLPGDGIPTGVINYPTNPGNPYNPPYIPPQIPPTTSTTSSTTTKAVVSQEPPVQTTTSTTTSTTTVVTTPTTSTTTSTTTLTTTTAPSKGNCQPPIYAAPTYYKWVDKGDCKYELVVDTTTYPNLAPAPVLPIVTTPIVTPIPTVTTTPTTTSTIQTTTTKSTLGTLPGSSGDGGTSGGGGGGGGSEEAAPTQQAPKKNYFWWYVGGALAIYLILKKKKN